MWLDFTPFADAFSTPEALQLFMRHLMHHTALCLVIGLSLSPLVWLQVRCFPLFDGSEQKDPNVAARTREQPRVLNSKAQGGPMKSPSPAHLIWRLVWRLLGACALTLVVLAFVVSWPTKAHAQTAIETPAAVFERIKTAVEQNTHGKVSVDAVVPTAIPGVYEVTSGNEVMYVDATGRYALDGRMVDMLDQRDLTAARLEQLHRIDFQKLPLDLAIKTVHGSGKRTMAVFEDPACPVCRALSKFIDQIPDVTVYRFMYPVIDPSSIPRAQAAWCAKDRKAAWASLMKGGPAPSAAPCDTTGLRRIVALGEQLQINGTPTVFLGDGRRLVGATPPEQFIAALNESAR